MSANPQAPDGWFTAEHERFFDRVIRERKCRVCVELGTFLGDGAICMARAQLAAGLTGMVYAVDHFQGSPEHQADPQVLPLLPRLRQLCEANIDGSGMAGRITVIEADTRDAVTMIPPELDLVYVDAGHDTESVRGDVLRYLSLVRPGGIICGDDWNWPTVRTGVLSVLPMVEVVADRIWWIGVNDGF